MATEPEASSEHFQSLAEKLDSMNLTSSEKAVFDAILDRASSADEVSGYGLGERVLGDGLSALGSRLVIASGWFDDVSDGPVSGVTNQVNEARPRQ